MSGPETTLWNAEDVAKYLKCSRSYVYKAVEAGLLKPLRIGAMVRFDPVVVRRFAGVEQDGG